MPNIAPPGFHPGEPKGKKLSRVVRSGPIRLSILSETEDEKWGVMWDIFPRYASMTLFKKGPEPYWMLYEGTPGGAFDMESDYWVDSAGTRRSVAPYSLDEGWQEKLPNPQWVYFGDTKMPVFYMSLHEPDDEWDEFWHRGEGGMTGQWFYRNPGGDMTASWQRIPFGDLVDAVLVTNVDDDEFADVIALKCNEQFWFEAKDLGGNAWRKSKIGSLPVCNHNTGAQGYTLAQLAPGGKPEIVLTGDGLLYLQIPDNPEQGSWRSWRSPMQA